MTIPIDRFIPSVALAVTAGFGLAAEPVPIAGLASQDRSAEGIDSTIELRNQLADDPTRRTLFPGWYDGYRDWREGVHEKIRLETTLTYDVAAQGYGSADHTFGTGAGDLTLGGRWTPLKMRVDNTLSLGFRLRYRHALFGLLPPSEIRSRTGLLWGTVDGFSDAGFRVPDFYLTQQFFDDRLELRYGQVTTSNVVDTNGLHSAKRFFLNQAFSSNPAVAFPISGAGLFARWKSPRGWDVTAGGSNVQGTRIDDNVSWKLDSDALFFAMQFGVDFQGLDSRPARLQLLTWRSDALPDEGLSEGEGFSLTFEQKEMPVAGRMVLRYAYANSDPTLVDHFAAVGFSQDFRKFDQWGLGVGVGRSSTDSSRWQGALELYYRWQATREFQLTPDLQLIAGKGTDDGEDFQVVVGIRGGLTF